MRLPQVRFTVRRMMIAVVLIASLIAIRNAVVKRLGPRPGIYGGSYVYLGSDWKWHEIRGRIICVWPNGGISTE
jgi:hypothetical protein